MDTQFRQIGGDINPASYGGAFFRPSCTEIEWVFDPECGDLEVETVTEIEIFVLEPVADLVGEEEAADLDNAYWGKTTSVSRDDVVDLLADEGWRSFVGADDQDLPDPKTAEWQAVAALAATDDGYGNLDWEQIGNLSGEEIWNRFSPFGYDGKPLEDDLLEEDEEHRARRC